MDTLTFFLKAINYKKSKINMKQIILTTTLFLLTGCNNTKPVEKTDFDTVVVETIDSIKYTVEFLNSLEWTEEEIQHLDTLSDNLVCKNAERELDTIINHIKVKFTKVK